MQTAPSTCIVVPAYNEAGRLDASELDAFLEKTSDVGFVLVNDGSTDSTLALLRGIAARWPARVRVLDLQPNRGKAEAVRAGMVEAMAIPGTQLAGYWDADWATPLGEINAFARCLNDKPNVDIVLGTRVALLGRAIERKLHRHYLGRVSATFTSIALGLPVYDTQCGAKLMRVTERTRGLFTESFRSGWVFDVEVIARYVRSVGSAAGIYELPLEKWTDVGESKVRPIDFLRSLGQLARIYRDYRLPQRYRRAVDIATAPFVRYAGAGALGTLIHYVVLVLSVENLGVATWLGASVGASAGALVNYVLNYHFTFASNRQHKDTLPKFLAVAALGIGINALIVKVGVEELRWHYLLAQLGATVAVLAIGFVLNRIWTFNE